MGNRSHRRLSWILATVVLVSIVLLCRGQKDALASAAVYPITCSAGAAGVDCESDGSLQQQSAEEQLAEKYVPILNMTKQSAPCDKDGDVYFPTTVDFVFNNPDVELKANGDGSDNDDPLIASPVTPQDLVTAGAETYLNFPGDPRDPGCNYENYFSQKVAEFGLKPTTYAHIYYDPVERKLWLEYWFYYYFNDWNDTHESDWEMLLMNFNASSVEDALSISPNEVGYAQHGGGELHKWTDEKIEKSGDHVIAYASAGSHATYYDQATYIGWGENGTAFGCDKTLPEYNRYELDVSLVPSSVDPNSPFAWALYQGRWGQREQAVFNGPKGPNTGKKWNDPAAAVESWRPTSLTVPGGSTTGPSTTNLFCRFSENISKAGIYLGSHPWATVLTILAVVAAFSFMMWKVWPFFLESIDIYGNELRTFLAIGMTAIPIGIIFNAIVVFLIDVPPLEWINEWFNGGTDGKAGAVAFAGGLQHIAMLLIITPSVIYAMKLIRMGEKPGVWRSYWGGVRYWPYLILLLIVFFTAVAVLTLTFILIPIAIYLTVRWQFFAQATVLDDKLGVGASLRASMSATNRQWWRALLFGLAFQIIGILPGPVIGMLVLIIGGSNVQFANLLSSFLYAIFLPIAYIGLTMAYHRLKGDPIVEPDMQTHKKGAGETRGMVSQAPAD